MGVFGHGLWCCPSSVGCLWCSWLGFGVGLLMGRVWFRGRPACLQPFPVPVCGVGACAGPRSRLRRALLGWVVRVWFLRFLFFCFFFFFFFPCPGPCGSCPPSPSLSGWAGGSPFFFFSVSLFPVGRCSRLCVAGFGSVVPPSRCRSCRGSGTPGASSRKEGTARRQGSVPATAARGGGQEATGEVPRGTRRGRARAHAARSKGANTDGAPRPAAVEGGRAQAADGATQGREPRRARARARRAGSRAGLPGGRPRDAWS